ncbi:MAG TPA: TIGR03560 family F420-dependent LLM class oxidoreductase [Ktedonobacteraceae bacterium]|nr:TIGR03560 family F420-dependent LLM class oxidoreductase [Ktedonobacteraceae bacterium]
MVDISIMIEGQNGLIWPQWKQIVAEVEESGFAGLFRSDHFTNARPPDLDSLEMIVSLAYLADHTQRLHFGPMVAPVSFRDPILLARQAAAIDDLSGGRLLLGIGAGWQDREHQLFGYELGDVPTRMSRLAEALEVVSLLFKSDEPVEYHGTFYHLNGATLLPRPQRPGGPRILIGGTGIKRTLPLAARYATVWNGPFLAPDAFQERSTHLDTLLAAEGRKPEEVKRSVMLSLFFGRDNAELEQLLGRYRKQLDLGDLPIEQVVAKLTERGSMLVGTSEQILEQIAAYSKAGVEEFMLQWFDYENLDGLRAFAHSVLPQL